jgi:hypothetical protein
MNPLLIAVTLATVLCGPTLATQWYSPAPPDWVRHLPSGDQYQYFRGEGEGPSQERAKAKARTDAVRKAVMWQEGVTTTEMVDQVKINQIEAIVSELTAAAPGTHLAGLEWVDDYHEVDEYQEPRPLVDAHGNVVRDSWGLPVTQGLTTHRTHHCYVLIRLPKKGPGVMGQMARGTARRLDAVFHSALYPGWGQFRQQRETEGTVYLLAGTAFLGLVVYSHLMADQYPYPPPPGEQQWERRQDWAKYRNASLGGYGLVWGVSLVDALLFGRQAEEYRGLSLRAGPQGVVLAAAIRF